MTPDTPPGKTPYELTIRAIVLGAVLTVVFTAANVYLGLKIGLTFATSIPAAVISMAVLRWFRGTTLQEDNIVQTIASAAGTLSAIIFVLPGLIMIGWWHTFPYWQSVAVIAVGGILGVMYSVPLRRALVTGSDLPYPEGVAAAEVLKVGTGAGGKEENALGLRTIMAASLLSAGFALLGKMRLVAEEASLAVRLGPGATSLSASFSLAFIGVGHLVGLAVGLAMLAGLVIGWLVLLPCYTAPGLHEAWVHGLTLQDFVQGTFKHKVRFVGAGTIGVAAVWTLLRVIGPVVKGIGGALASARMRREGRGGELPLGERDLPIGIVGAVILLALVPVALLLVNFGRGGPVEAHFGLTLALTLAYVLGIGLMIAAVCGYMAGLIGASNSPISGTGILSALGMALLLAALFGRGGDPGQVRALVAFALFVTAIVFGVATISNDNLQDLKTGQLVGATPWRQQVALVLGVIFGALVIPPLLSLLNTTFGFQGTPGAGPQALAAPQAALISAIAQGVLGGSLDWNLIGLGAMIGVGAILIDEALRAWGKGSLPPLAVGMGIYLPMGLTLLIPLGALIGHAYDRWAKAAPDPALEHRAKKWVPVFGKKRCDNKDLAGRLGVLAATGLIAGESLFGVMFAGIAAASGKPAPLAVMPEGWMPAEVLALLLFSGAVGWLYLSVRRAAAAGKA